MSKTTPDVIDLLLGAAAAKALAPVRAGRAAARDNAQLSYQALFAPVDVSDVSLEERFALARFVAALHRDASIAKYYEAQLVAAATSRVADAISDEVRRGETTGPCGRYPAGPLSNEDAPGIVHRVTDSNRRILGTKLSAGLEHAHLLVFRPRDSSPTALQALLDAGWSTTGIVTLSQLVAFLSFQIRVVTGLRALAAAQSAPKTARTTAVPA